MTNRLQVIKDNPAARSKPRCLGRGIGSGKGKTCGKGHKGYWARSGGGKAGFEGGQTPIFRRMPKRGFKSHFVKPYELTFDRLHTFMQNGLKVSDDTLNLETLIEQKFVAGTYRGLVMIDSQGGEVYKFTYQCDRVSKIAREKIEKAGGKIA